MLSANDAMNISLESDSFKCTQKDIRNQIFCAAKTGATQIIYMLEETQCGKLILKTLNDLGYETLITHHAGCALTELRVSWGK